ncbi:cadherin-1 [Puntigrus tetrazona]|uniref:cadherin-1 n=1 Tax=Puntigrus tetrazona TaxID=1606681 RepID=UPI001C89ACA1|nr:cadherin-1 [Puntigrus tetrazona]
MACVGIVRFGVIVFLCQVLCVYAEESTCKPGFESELFVFKVHRDHLHRGKKLGRVIFINFDGRTSARFHSVDKRFDVNTDGMVTLKRHVTLHEGRKLFSVHAWDSSGQKHTASVKVERVHRHNHTDTDMSSFSPEMELPSHQVLTFPKPSCVKRVKRGWVIPPISVPENSKGPFPMFLVQMKSDYAMETQMIYSITGEGADLEPKRIFTVERLSGNVFVTQPLDREKKAEYKLVAHAKARDVDKIEEKPMPINVKVIDQNDNRPEFTQNPFNGQVHEAATKDFEFMTVTATDKDDPDTDNGIIRYSIVSQKPELPKPNMFDINSSTGTIRVLQTGLDREQWPTYTLIIVVADMEGKGMATTGTAVITITDSNDNPPKFDPATYNVSVPENKVGHEVARLKVTDEDDVGSPAWTTKYRIINGDKGGFFTVSTGPNTDDFQEGIITTVKPLDFEKTKQYILLVIVENEVPFVGSFPTSTATVTVNVEDVNEPPEFNPKEKLITKREDTPVGTELVVYTAIDPDTARAQKITYSMGSDPDNWLSISADTGSIKVAKEMDRESIHVKDGKYTAIILATDNEVKQNQATGTGTLVIDLEDVNDNAPFIVERNIQMCNREAPPVLLSIVDHDGPLFAQPFNVEPQGETSKNWSTIMNATLTGVFLKLDSTLEQGDYNVVLRVFDRYKLFKDSTIRATVCDCAREEFHCTDKQLAGMGLSGVLGILGGILALLLLVLLLLLFMRRRGSTKKEPLLAEDDIRDNIYYYDEEGGGEDDQDYDLSVLHRGLDNRPEVFRIEDVAPTFLPAPQYRPRPANPEEIGTFIDDNLKAADNDPTAPPYDSLLVFDYEGGGSDAGSLSSLNSSSSGHDQDYDFLNEWGPRFKKLADMFGGGED